MKNSKKSFWKKTKNKKVKNFFGIQTFFGGKIKNRKFPKFIFFFRNPKIFTFLKIYSLFISCIKLIYFYYPLFTKSIKYD